MRVPLIVVLVVFGFGTLHAQREQGTRNQASPADTIFYPSESETTTRQKDGTEVTVKDTDPPTAKSIAALKRVLAAAGLTGLNHLALLDADIDEDGCMAPPIQVRPHYVRTNGGEGHEVFAPSSSLLAMAEVLRAHGITVTILDGAAIGAADSAQQAKLKATKGSYSLSYGQGSGRYFATSAERNHCMGMHEGPSNHPALANALTAIGQDAVLAIGRGDGDSRGPNWNIMDASLGSGDGTSNAKAQAEIDATLILKGGVVAWQDKKFGYGKLSPAKDKEAMKLLMDTMHAFEAEMEAYHKAHPNAQEMPPDGNDKKFNAIVGGKLEEAPVGSTLGPSLYATQKGTAELLYAQIGPALGGH